MLLWRLRSTTRLSNAISESGFSDKDACTKMCFHPLCPGRGVALQQNVSICYNPSRGHFLSMKSLPAPGEYRSQHHILLSLTHGGILPMKFHYRLSSWISFPRTDHSCSSVKRVRGTNSNKYAWIYNIIVHTGSIFAHTNRVLAHTIRWLCSV